MVRMYKLLPVFGIALPGVLGGLYASMLMRKQNDLQGYAPNGTAFTLIE